MKPRKIHLLLEGETPKHNHNAKVLCGSLKIWHEEQQSNDISLVTCIRCRLIFDRTNKLNNVVDHEPAQAALTKAPPSQGVHVGYTRVSTIEQNTERQLLDVKLTRIFEDKLSGKDRERPALVECLGFVRAGDTLHVHSIDRLARNLLDLENIILELTKKGVSVNFHKEKMIFTGDNDPMKKVLLQMLGCFAEFERAIMRERQKEGIAVAKKNGVKFGRRPKISNDQKKEIFERLKSGENAKDISTDYNIHKQSVYRIKYELE